MKRRYAAILGIGIVLAGMFTAQSASAAGGWQPYGTNFVTPSNWYCGGSASGAGLSAQTCVVRSGNYVQSATIVRNNTSAEISAQVSANLGNGDDWDALTTANCASSGIAANSVSVCFSPTVFDAPPGAHSSAKVNKIGTWLFSPYV